MSQCLSKTILKLLGWSVEVRFPLETKKMVFAGAPHTSNWDFIFSILCRSAAGFKSNFVAKHSLFRFPTGWTMRKLGGIPVNRKTTKNFVQQIVDIYNEREQLGIAFTPEGTRKKVDRFKTGFYHIAKQAKVPIILVQFNFADKIYVFDDLFFPTDDMEADMDYIENYFSGVKGKNGVFVSQRPLPKV